MSSSSQPCSQTKRTQLLPPACHPYHTQLRALPNNHLYPVPPLSPPPPGSALWHQKHAQPILTFSSPRDVVQPGWANKHLVTAKYGPTLAPARNFQPLWSQTHLHSSIWSKTLILWKICSLSKSCALTHAFKVSLCLAARGSSRLPKKEGAVNRAHHVKEVFLLFQPSEDSEDLYQFIFRVSPLQNKWNPFYLSLFYQQLNKSV